MEADLSETNEGFGRLAVPPPPPVAPELDDDEGPLGPVDVLDDDAMDDLGGWDKDLDAGGLDSLRLGLFELEEDAKADEVEEESGVMRESSPLGVGGGEMKATFFSTGAVAPAAPEPAPQGALPFNVSFPDGRPFNEERGAF